MKLYISSEDGIYSHTTAKDVISIGRADTNDFCVPLSELSREHCKLLLHGDKLFIVDLESKNGVYVDGNRINPNQKWPISLSSTIHLSTSCVLSFNQPVRVDRDNTLDTTDIKLDMPRERQIELKRRK